MIKLFKWCEPKMKSEYSSYKGNWLRTHQLFLRPGDIVFAEDTENPDMSQHFKVVGMPYKVQDLTGLKDEYSIDLQPIEWKGKP